jgi:serine/threonine protein kinase, bacterial
VTKDRTSGGACAASYGASTMDLSGRCVGSSYILQHPIGQGATGTVWRGLERASGEPVAVKLLHESLLRQPKLVTRFVQERTILLMLRHRNVVRVRDLFSVGETLGLVMDLVDGGSLRDHLRERGPVPAGEAARLAGQVAAALAEAHQLGVIHRDLKPDNILLCRDGGRLDTRLTDFGVARILNTPSMTTPSAVLGTPHYMAPEAFHGTTASPATDVYALGVLLYELVAGRPPYDSDSIPDLMRRHMEGNPEQPRGIAEPIWDLILQCMATKPRLRPSAAELVVSLSEAARDCAGTAALPPPPPRLRSAAPVEEGGADEPDPVSIVPLPRIPVAVHDDGGVPDLRGADPAGPRAAGPHGVGSRGVGPHGVGSRSAGPHGVGPHGVGPHGSGPAGDPPHQRTGYRAGGDDAQRCDAPHRDDQQGDDRPGLAKRDRDGRGGSGSRPKDRGNAAPGWRWARPGATLIAMAMLGSAVAATAWHLGRADHDGAGAEVPPRVVAAPSGRVHPPGGAAGGARVSRKAVAAPGPVRPEGPETRGAAAARSVTAAPVPPKSPAQSATRTRSPQPEAKPYGPLQCAQRLAFDFGSRTPLVTKPCHTVGRDVQYQAALTAPGGATGSITVSLQETATGRTAAGPKTCAALNFAGDAATQACGPAAAKPARGRSYVVVMTYRYERYGRVLAGTAKGSAFSW